MEMRAVTGKSRADRFLETIHGAEKVLILTHDNPDPDAIASGWAIHFLIENKLKLPTRFRTGGIIARAENRMFMKTLKPPLILSSKHVLPGPSEAVVLVDTAYSPRIKGAGDRMLDAVIDHHYIETRGIAPVAFRFKDIRPQVLSTSSIVSCYLKHFSLEPTPALATALSYGIDSDAKGRYCRFTQTDRSAVSWLSQFADPEMLAKIESPELPRQYYSDLLLGLESCFTYGPVAFCFLPSASGTEAVGETADLLIQCEEIERLLCAAQVGSRIVLSARTTAEGGDATLLLGKAVAPHGGTWGGHEHRAGGSILVHPGADIEAIEGRIKASWLHATGATQRRGERLVAKREILNALR